MTNKLPTDPRKPIVFHPVLNDQFADWAAACNWHPRLLRKATEKAIRTRHQEATIKHESHRAKGRQPDIWTLSLGSVEVIYTVQPHAVVIRGYGWDLHREPLDDFDGGGHYPDYD